MRAISGEAAMDATHKFTRDDLGPPPFGEGLRSASCSRIRMCPRTCSCRRSAAQKPRAYQLNASRNTGTTTPTPDSSGTIRQTRSPEIRPASSSDPTILPR